MFIGVDPHVTLVAVVSRLVLDAALVADLLALADQPVPEDLDVLHGLQQAVPAGDTSVVSALVFSLFWNPAYRPEHLVGVGIGDLDGAGHVPGDVNHGHDGFDLLDFVPLVPLQGQLVLVTFTHTHSQNALMGSNSPFPDQDTALTVERSHVPGDVVAPPDSLNPVDGAGIDPHQVSGPLDEAVHGDVAVVEVLQDRPPGARQVIDSVSARKKST